MFPLNEIEKKGKKTKISIDAERQRIKSRNLLQNSTISR